jgi:hypothetical protein
VATMTTSTAADSASGVGARAGGAAGIAFVVLALAGNSLTGGGADAGAEPGAYAEEVSRRTADAAWRVGLTLELVGFLALLVFAAALARRIRLVEPREGYAGLLVLAGGVVLTAVKLGSGAAVFAADRRAGDLDGQLARLLADLNASAFVLSFVPLALLLGAAAVAALAHGALPRALGWTGAPLAVLLVAAASTGSDAVPIPFLLSLVWIIAVGAVMLRRPVAIAS